MSAGALLGKDKYLFLCNDTNKVLDQFEGAYKLSDAQVLEINAVHCDRERILQELCEAKYYHVVVPNKETVFFDKLPDDYVFQSKGLSPVNFYSSFPFKKSHGFFYDPLFLRQLSQQIDVFPKTDTHWVHAGAIGYLQRVARYFQNTELENALLNIVYDKKVGQQAGDLGMKLNLPVEQVELWNVSNYASKLVSTNKIANEGCVRCFKNENAPIKKRVLVLHDSTALWLMPTITSVYEEVLFLHLPDFDTDWIKQYKPDVVFFIQIERFFIRSPLNGVSFFEVVSKYENLKNSTSPQANIFSLS